MWIVREGVLELYDADVLLLLMLSLMLAAVAVCLLTNAALRTVWLMRQLVCILFLL